MTNFVCKREGFLTVRKAIILLLAFGIYNYVVISKGKQEEKEEETKASLAHSNNSSFSSSLRLGLSNTAPADERKISKNITKGIKTYTFQMRPKRVRDIKKPNRKKHFLEDKVFVMDDVWTEEKMAEQSRIFEDRASTLAASCEQMEDNPVLHRNISGVHDNIRWVTKHNFIWCPVYKAASTTWMSNLLLLAGIKSAKNSFHKQVKKLYPPPEDLDERKRLLETSLKMLIVRHPLERLLSAYRDKMLRDDQFQRLSRIIRNTYPDRNADENDKHPTFFQFLQYIKQNMKKFWHSGGTSRVNPHWQPVWWTCGPCQIKYEAIAHMETLTADQEYIIRKAGLKDLAVNAHTHSSSLDSYKGTDKATKDYYSQIPKNLIKQVSDLYKQDFQLFGYSPEEYIKMGTE